MSSQAESWLRLPCSCLTKYEEKKEKENKNERHILINVFCKSQFQVSRKQEAHRP